MNEIRYEIIMYWSTKDAAFIAEVPELAGCMADGETYDEALANAQVVFKNGSKRRENLGERFLNPKVD
jgi:predicted RNase H-like HicB family nuclease